MPYRVKVGSVSAIVANEKEALDLLGKLQGESGEVSILDVLGVEVSVGTLKTRLGEPTSGENV